MSDLKANQTVHAVKASAELSEPVSTNRSFSILFRENTQVPYFLRCASLVAQIVKNLLARKTLV